MADKDPIELHKTQQFEELPAAEAPSVPELERKKKRRKIILALLAERPMYGYEMVKLVNARSGGLLEWKEGPLYPTLHRLEGEGLLKAEWRENAPTGKQRKYYRITGSGRRELSKRAAACVI